MNFGVIKMDVDSPQWLQATEGILTQGQRARLVGRLARELPMVLADRLAAAWWRRARSRGDPSELWDAQPTSDAALLAVRECEAGLTKAFVNHSYRTWMFGNALAKRDGHSLDAEQLFVAAMLHDLGLGHPTYRSCFTGAGVNGVRRIAHFIGRPDDFENAARGISGHITPGLSKKGNLYALYVQRGSMLDLVGTRAIHLPKQFVLDVYKHHCDEDIRYEAGARWHAEAAMVRHGRTDLIQRWGRMSLLCRLTPLPPKP